MTDKLTDDSVIARTELGEALSVLSDLIPDAEDFEKAADAVIAVANSWWRAGERREAADR